MPTVTKHTSNNLVTVSYPVREAVLDITHAEHSLIMMFSHEKVKMIKFIRAQYNLGLYDAQQVIDIVIAYAEVESLMRSSSGGVETEIDWSKVPEGTLIYVRDSDYEDWCERKFIRYNPNSVSRFVCKTSDEVAEWTWQRAKLIND